MRKTTVAFLLSAVSLGACATVAASDVALKTEARTVPEFSSIVLNGIGTVRVHRGPRKVLVTLNADLLDRYETIVKGKTLMIGFKCGIGTLRAMRNVKTCEVDVTVPELDKIELNGKGTIIADSFSGSSMDIVQNGASTLQCDLAYETVRLNATGAGSIALRGSASKLDVRSTGNEKIEARDLVARVARIRVSGAGKVTVSAEDALDASVSGAGRILFSGNPQVTQRVSGAGTIQRAG